MDFNENDTIIVIKYIASSIYKGFCYKPYIFGEEHEGSLSGKREFNTIDEAKDWVDKHISYDKLVAEKDIIDSRIKKCPFCGKPGVLIEHPYEWGYNDPSYDVGCLDKNCRGHVRKSKYSMTASSTREEAIKKWNKRV